MRFPAYSNEPERAVVVTRKQSTRLIKVVCADAACGAVLRITRRYINQGKIPTCACGNKMHTEARLRLVGSSIELNTGASIHVGHIGRLWALVASAKRGLTTDEPFCLGNLSVMKIDGNGDIYAASTNAAERSNCCLVIRFGEVESIASICGWKTKGGDSVRPT